MPDELQQYPTEDIILILSKLPEFLRKSMMRSKLIELCAKDSNSREELIDPIMDGLSSADTDSLKKVIRTWLGVVSSLGNREISTIFSTFISKYERDPSLSNRDYFAVLFDSYQLLEENQKVILRDCLVEVFLNQYQGRQMVLALPKQVLSALELQ